MKNLRRYLILNATGPDTDKWSGLGTLWSPSLQKAESEARLVWPEARTVAIRTVGLARWHKSLLAQAEMADRERERDRELRPPLFVVLTLMGGRRIIHLRVLHFCQDYISGRIIDPETLEDSSREKDGTIYDQLQVIRLGAIRWWQPMEEDRTYGSLRVRGPKVYPDVER